MEIIKLKTRTRSGTGKSYTRKARLKGWVPAIYYGKKTKPQPIEVDQHEFAAIVRNKHLTHLIDLGLGTQQEDSIAVIKEMQRHVIRDNWFYHIDFQHVAMDEKVTVHCPVQITGIAIGVKEESGVLGNPVKSFTIECFPMDIPENISIDVSGLHVGDSIHIKDISIPNITIKDSPEEVVAVVTHATREIVETPPVEEAAAEETADATAPEAPTE
ncbi:MAG: 50S ribosomal protein L25 [Chitinispirillaceae bacterium]|nr:50S ribosomal protein L25 [Chitinispirillaceae bacterium]